MGIFIKGDSVETENANIFMCRGRELNPQGLATTRT